MSKTIYDEIVALREALHHHNRKYYVDNAPDTTPVADVPPSEPIDVDPSTGEVIPTAEEDPTAGFFDEG